MPVELRIPEALESISKVRVVVRQQSEGESVSVDEVVAEIETDKARLELPCPISRRIAGILVKEGAETAVGEVIAVMEASDATHGKPFPDGRPEDRWDNGKVPNYIACSGAARDAIGEARARRGRA